MSMWDQAGGGGRGASRQAVDLAEKVLGNTQEAPPTVFSAAADDTHFWQLFTPASLVTM